MRPQVEEKSVAENKFPNIFLIVKDIEEIGFSIMKLSSR